MAGKRPGVIGDACIMSTCHKSWVCIVMCMSVCITVDVLFRFTCRHVTQQLPRRCLQALALQALMSIPERCRIKRTGTSRATHGAVGNTDTVTC